MRQRFFTCTALLAVASVTLVACGDDDDASSATTVAAADTPSAAVTAAPDTTAASGGRGDYGSSAASVPAGGDTSLAIATTGLGDVLTAGDGWTLYIFMPDESGTPTCLADCASNWPPEISAAAPAAGDGVDAALIGAVTNPEGGEQVTYNGWPLYRFANDAAAGDTNGQGVGGVWYVIGADGEPIQ